MNGGSSVNFWRFIIEYFAVDAICTTCNHIDKRGRIEYEKNKIGIRAKIGTYYEIETNF